MLRVAQLAIGQSGRGQDRVAAFVRDGFAALVVADGAGSSSRGGDAADVVVDAVRVRSEAGAFDVVEVLRECDRALAGSGGETTAVVTIVDEHGIRGASVGDSGAWLIEAATHVDLTEHQLRKPLIGSGQARPVPFSSGPLRATLLLASDGLFKYASATRLRALVSSQDFERVPEQLVASVRLRSGALQDDAAVLICRRDG